VQLAARSYIPAGVALISASALAISPVAPPVPDLPDIREAASVSRNVALTALANPFAPVFQEALEDVAALVERIAANPAPILQQVIENQLRSAQTLVGIGGDYVQNMVHFLTAGGSGTLRGQLDSVREALQAGDYGLAFGYLSALPILALTAGDVFGTLDTVLPQIVGVLAQPFANIAAAITAIGDPQNILPLALGVVQAINGTAQTFGEGLEGVAAALQTGNPTAVVNAILEGSANTLGSVLTGLLASDPDNPFGNGIIGGLLSLREAIARAIAPPAAAPAAATPLAATAVTEVPNETATFVNVTLDTAPASTDEPSAGADNTATDPEPETVTPTAGDEEEPAPTATDETEDVVSDEDDETGETDLSDGNKVTPGDTVTDDSSGGEAGADEADATDGAADADATDTDDTADAGSGDSDSGDSTGDAE
jgi:hypothetical protein